MFQNWVISSLKTSPSNPKRTSTKFSNNTFVLNIQTIKRNNCFELCNLAASHYRDIKNKKSRSSIYEKVQKNDLCDAENPVKSKYIGKIEGAGDLSIYVFALDTEVYSIRIPNMKGFPGDLLQLEKDGRYHYCLFTSFNGFMRRETKMENQFYCRRCLTGSSILSRFKTHQLMCSEQPGNGRLSLCCKKRQLSPKTKLVPK